MKEKLNTDITKNVEEVQLKCVMYMFIFWIEFSAEMEEIATATYMILFYTDRNRIIIEF